MGRAPTGYERQVRPGGTAALPFASPDAFGAAFGRGVGEAGASIERIEEDERRQRDNDQAADFNVRFAQARLETEKAAIDARAGAAPGGAGHSDAIAKAWAERSAALTEGLTDPDIQKYARERVANWGAEFESREYSWEKGAQVEKLVTDVATTRDLVANRVRNATDPKALGEEIDLFDDFVDVLSIAEDTKEKLRSEARGRIARSFVEGMTERDPRAAEAVIKSGALAAYLDPQDIDLLAGEAGVGIRREEVEARATAAAQKAEAAEKVEGLQRRLRDHVPVPDAEIVAHAELAKSAGLDGDVYDLAKARAINNDNRVFRAATPVQIDQAIKTLDATIAKAGDKADPLDVIRRDNLKSMLPARTEQLRSDPLGFGAQLGMTIGPLNLDDPASIATRIGQAKAIAAATGAPVRVLTDEEADLLGAQAKAGGAGRMQAAEQLARMGAYHGRLAAMQAAPEDQLLQRAVTLPPRSRALALQGAEFRKANPKILPEADARETYQELTGAAIASLGGEFNAATAETANTIYAAIVGSNGLPSEKLNEAVYIRAVNLALGATARGGGQWQGGLGRWNGAPVLLPSTMSQAEFDGAMANIARLDGAANGSPAWADGSPVQAGQLRGQLRPVAVRDGVYQFETRAGQVLGRKDGGGAWLLDIRKVKR